ncbi:MAG: 1-phosphofructokinase [Pseudomonas sp.]|uniref:1-phosphofructokinase n=1 Tax=Pseudomonas sp. TaxID=306 RepID=UPI0033914795
MARILTLTLNPALDLTLGFDSLQLGTLNRSQEQHCSAAGKGLNVAQVLVDLGHQVTVSGFLGSANATPFEALFARRDFVDAFVRVPGETRSNIKLVERDGRVTDLNGRGAWVEASHRAQLLERLLQIAPGYDALVVAGSLPPGVELDWFVELLRVLKTLCPRLALDSSGDALRAGLGVAPWLIKPNEEELAEACGLVDRSLPSLRAAVRALRERDGIEHVLLSRGRDGVDWHGPGFALQARPPQVEVRSTVGAGDSLLAASLHGLLEGWPVERTLRLATAVAAQAVTQLGFGIQDPEQLAHLQAGVVLAPNVPQE